MVTTDKADFILKTCRQFEKNTTRLCCSLFKTKFLVLSSAFMTPPIHWIDLEGVKYTKPSHTHLDKIGWLQKYNL